MPAAQRPIAPGDQAAVDQAWAELDLMVSIAREHRVEDCVHLGTPCVGDELLLRLRHGHHTNPGRVVLLLAAAVARLADRPNQPSTTVIEGISPPWGT